MITEIFDSQHTRQVSNLDLTFEKSIEKKEKVEGKTLNLSGKGKFEGSHWNFGSRRQRGAKERRMA